MANVDIAALSEAVKQVESGGRRYDSSGKLLTSSKGAQGEMQVMPATARDPGFGVIPAQSDSPDELARVGRDYLSALVDKYDNVEHALVAYNWGPTNANKWIAAGANKEKLPRETRDYLGKVQNLMPKAAPKVLAEQTLETEPVKSVVAQGSGVSGSRGASVGSFSYKAALAASLLGNEAEEEGKDKDETVFEGMSEAVLPDLGGATASSALKNLDLRYRNPFDAVYPQDDPALLRMAEGGEVEQESAVARKLREALYGRKGQEMDPYEAEERAYRSSVNNKIGFPVPDERRDARRLLDYLESIDFMPTVRESDRGPGGRGHEGPAYRYNNNRIPGTINFPVNSPDAYRSYTHELSHAADRPSRQAYAALVAAIEAGGRDLTEQEKRFVSNYRKLYVTPTKLPLQFREGELLENKRYRRGAEELRAFGSGNMAQRMPKRGFSRVDIGAEFNPHVDPTMATEAAIMREMYRDLYKSRGKVGYAEGGEVAQTGIMQDIYQWLHENGISPTDFLAFLGTKGQGASLALLPGELNTGEEEELRRRREGEIEIGYAEGGEVADPEEAMFAGREDVPDKPRISNEEFIRESLKGLGEYPYLLAGAPVDLATMAMRPFGYDVEKPVMGSEWIKQKATEAGVRPEDTTDPRLRGPRVASEMLFSMMNPASTPRAAAKAVDIATDPKTKEAAKALLQDYMAAKEAQYYAIPGASYAIKPKGGVWLPGGKPPLGSPEGSPEFISAVYLDELVMLNNELSPEKYAAVKQLLESGKVEKYFKNKFATGDDPVRNAMLKGEIPFENLRPSEDQDKWGVWLEELNSSNPEIRNSARFILEKLYDKGSKVGGSVVVPARTEGSKYGPLLSNESKAEAEAMQRADEMIEAAVAKEGEKMSLEGVPKSFQPPDAVITPVEMRLPTSDYGSYDPEGVITRLLRNEPKDVAGLEGYVPPPAFTRAAETGEPIYSISSKWDGFPDIKAFEGQEVVNALATLTPKQLSKMNFEDALITGLKNRNADPLRFYKKDVDALESAIRNGTFSEFKPRSFKSVEELYKFGTKPVELPEGRQTYSLDTEWMQLTDPRATYLEGELMQHSVGGYFREATGYGGIGAGGREAFKKGDAVIYSLRNKNTGEPRGVTVEVDTTDPELIVVKQIKGEANRTPISRDKDIFELLYALEKKYQKENPDAELYVESQAYPEHGIHWQSAYENWLYNKDGRFEADWIENDIGDLEYQIDMGYGLGN